MTAGRLSGRLAATPEPPGGARPAASCRTPVGVSRWDFVIVGGGSAGCALANRLSADPGTRVLVLEAGRPDYRWDVFIHMPAALAFPIGSRFYDWRYQSEPEPFMGGRRVYHARGKVLGGSSSINGMIFQRGNPLDYERWAACPGMADLGLRPLPPLLQAHGGLPRGGGGRSVPRPWRAARPGARTGHSPLFGAFFEAVQQAGYQLTDDVNGYRQEGFAAVRSQHPTRPAALGGSGVPASGDAPAEPRGPDAALRDPGAVRGPRAATGVELGAGRRIGSWRAR